MTHVPWLVESLALFGLSLAATVIALRGRRVGDHPFCRRCGFDLFGKPPASSVCSECGAELAERKAVCVGRCERRGRLLAVAVPVMLVSAGWAGWDGWRAARGVDWNQHKPAWWLVREVNGTDPAARDAALIELARRIGDGRLPRERREALIAKALDVQADLARPWAPGWGTIIEAAHDTGGLPEAQWQRYMSQAITPVLSPVASPVHRGRDVEFRLQIVSPRVATTTVTHGQAMEAVHVAVFAEPQLLVEGLAVPIEEGPSPYSNWRGPPGNQSLFTGVTGWLDNTPHPLAAGEGIELLRTVSWAGPMRPTRSYAGPAMIHTAGRPTDAVKDGRHTAKLRLRLVPLRGMQDGPSSFRYVPVGPRFLTEVETTWDLRPIVRVSADPAVRDAVERSLFVERVVYRSSRGAASFTGVLGYRGTPPIALAYNVFVIDREQEFPAGAACFTPGGFARGVSFSTPADGWEARPPATVDIELRPDPDAAAPDVTAIWGGVVTLSNIPVVDGNAAPPNPGPKGGR